LQLLPSRKSDVLENLYMKKTNASDLLFFFQIVMDLFCYSQIKILYLQFHSFTFHWFYFNILPSMFFSVISGMFLAELLF